LLRDRVNLLLLLDRRLDIVRHAPIPDGAAVKENIASPRVAVAGLSHRADVAQGFALVQDVDQVDLLGAVELVQVVGDLFGEDAGDVRQGWKTTLWCWP
jgi:hypothetical protein